MVSHTPPDIQRPPWVAHPPSWRLSCYSASAADPRPAEDPYPEILARLSDLLADSNKAVETLSKDIGSTNAKLDETKDVISRQISVFKEKMQRAQRQQRPISSDMEDVDPLAPTWRTEAIQAATRQDIGEMEAIHDEAIHAATRQDIGETEAIHAANTGEMVAIAS